MNDSLSSQLPKLYDRLFLYLRGDLSKPVGYTNFRIVGAPDKVGPKPVANPESGGSVQVKVNQILFRFE